MRQFPKIKDELSMKLYLDTTSNTQTTVKLDDLKLIKDSSLWKSQVVLTMIEELLKKKGVVLKDITEIEVAIGPGSFTGIRVGLSIARALAYALNIKFDFPAQIRYSI